MIHGAVCVRVRVQESVAKELESVVGWFDELASVELEDVDIASRAAVTEDPDSNYWLREDSPEDCAHRYGASPPIVFYLFFFSAASACSRVGIACATREESIKRLSRYSHPCIPTGSSC